MLTPSPKQLAGLALAALDEAEQATAAVRSVEAQIAALAAQVLAAHEVSLQAAMAREADDQPSPEPVPDIEGLEAAAADLLAWIIADRRIDGLAATYPLHQFDIACWAGWPRDHLAQLATGTEFVTSEGYPAFLQPDLHPAVVQRFMLVWACGANVYDGEQITRDAFIVLAQAMPYDEPQSYQYQGQQGTIARTQLVLPDGHAVDYFIAHRL